MAEEKIVDQTQKETPPASAEKAPVEKSEDKIDPAKLSKPFEGDSLAKWMAQEGISGKEQPEEEPKEEPKKEPTVKVEEGTPEGKKPFKILKVQGKETPVYSEEEYDALASKGLDYTQKTQGVSDRDREVSIREQQVNEIIPALNKLTQLIESGKAPSPSGETEQAGDDVIDNDLLDPEFKKAYKALKDKNVELESRLNRTEATTNEQFLERAKTRLETVFGESKEKFPFDEIKTEEGRNLSENLFSGLVVVNFNNDKLQKAKDPAYKARDFTALFENAAQTMNAVEKYYESKFSGATSEEPPTKEILVSKYPEQTTALAQDAITEYLKTQDGAAPLAKSKKVEVKTTEKKKEFTGLDDAVRQGMKDPEIQEGLREIAKTVQQAGLKS